ncbi:hypothetical protein FRC01_007031, partial [Tulasnella sp. 417]
MSHAESLNSYLPSGTQSFLSPDFTPMASGTPVVPVQPQYPSSGAASSTPSSTPSTPASSRSSSSNSGSKGDGQKHASTTTIRNTPMMPSTGTPSMTENVPF